jgi:uncharacterized protein YycO
MKNWIRKSFIYKLLARFLTWFGDIRIELTPPATRARHFRKLLTLVQPGDVICRKYDSYLDSIFIPGEYTHSGIVTHKDTMIHAIAEGVERIDVLDFVLDTEGFILLRPRYDREINVMNTVIFAENQVGKPYDFLFEYGESETFYCHELTAKSLSAGGIPILRKNRIIYANDIIPRCRVIYESDTDTI